MLPEHRQKEFRNDARPAGLGVADNDIEPRAIVPKSDVHRPDIALRAEAVGQNPPVGKPRDHPLDNGMTDAQSSEAVEWNVANEGLERLTERVKIAVKIEMFRIDVGDDRDRRRQPSEAAVALV